jgi:hypothetical protein
LRALRLLSGRGYKPPSLLPGKIQGCQELEDTGLPGRGLRALRLLSGRGYKPPSLLPGKIQGCQELEDTRLPSKKYRYRDAR